MNVKSSLDDIVINIIGTVDRTSLSNFIADPISKNPYKGFTFTGCDGKKYELVHHDATMFDGHEPDLWGQDCLVVTDGEQEYFAVHADNSPIKDPLPSRDVEERSQQTKSVLDQHLYGRLRDFGYSPKEAMALQSAIVTSGDGRDMELVSKESLNGGVIFVGTNAPFCGHTYRFVKIAPTGVVKHEKRHMDNLEGTVSSIFTSRPSVHIEEFGEKGILVSFGSNVLTHISYEIFCQFGKLSKEIIRKVGVADASYKNPEMLKMLAAIQHAEMRGLEGDPIYQEHIIDLVFDDEKAQSKIPSKDNPFSEEFERLFEHYPVIASRLRKVSGPKVIGNRDHTTSNIVYRGSSFPIPVFVDHELTALVHPAYVVGPMPFQDFEDEALKYVDMLKTADRYFGNSLWGRRVDKRTFVKDAAAAGFHLHFLKGAQRARKGADATEHLIHAKECLDVFYNHQEKTKFFGFTW